MGIKVLRLKGKKLKHDLDVTELKHVLRLAEF